MEPKGKFWLVPAIKIQKWLNLSVAIVFKAKAEAIVFYNEKMEKETYEIRKMMEESEESMRLRAAHKARCNDGISTKGEKHEE